MDKVYPSAAAARHAGARAVLAVVIRAAGHTPQVVGARMLILDTGEVIGTVGGGRFEFEVCQHAHALTRPERLELALGPDIGMCCGGLMEVLLTPIGDDDTWLDRAADTASGDIWVRTSLQPESLGQRQLTTEGPTLCGNRRFENAAVLDSPTGATLWERLQPPRRLVLFGAGHVSQPLAQLAAMLGWHVVVIDDRPQWNSAARFPNAERLLETYEDLLMDFGPRPSDALVIMTRGHDFDLDILAAVHDAPVAYLGMIGSKGKVHRTLKKLNARGIATPPHLHAPIGLDIGALTPEEIAVSVAAELVDYTHQTRVGETRPREVTP